VKPEPQCIAYTQYIRCWVDWTDWGGISIVCLKGLSMNRVYTLLLAPRLAG
jgi:hypothetical protein